MKQKTVGAFVVPCYRLLYYHVGATVLSVSHVLFITVIFEIRKLSSREMECPGCGVGELELELRLG